MYYKTLRIRSKLVCLSKPVKVTNNKKDTSLLQNMCILCNLRVRNFYSTCPAYYNTQLITVVKCF
jgi:hypothetical protein